MDLAVKILKGEYRINELHSEKVEFTYMEISEVIRKEDILKVIDEVMGNA